jgi:hypothetical protein
MGVVGKFRPFCNDSALSKLSEFTKKRTMVYTVNPEIFAALKVSEIGLLGFHIH